MQLPLSPRLSPQTPKTPKTPANAPKTPPASPLVNLVQMTSPILGDMSPEMMSPSCMRRAMGAAFGEVSPTLHLAAARLCKEAAAAAEREQPRTIPGVSPEKIRKPLPKLLGALQPEGNNFKRHVHFEDVDKSSHQQAHAYFMDRRRQRAERNSGVFAI